MLIGQLRSNQNKTHARDREEMSTYIYVVYWHSMIQVQTT